MNIKCQWEFVLGKCVFQLRGRHDLDTTDRILVFNRKTGINYLVNTEQK